MDEAQDQNLIEDSIDYLSIEYRVKNLQNLLPGKVFFTDKILMVKLLEKYHEMSIPLTVKNRNIALKIGSKVLKRFSSRYFLLDRTGIYLFKSKNPSCTSDFYCMNTLKTVYFCENFSEVILKFDDPNLLGHVCIKFQKESKRNEFLKILTVIIKKIYKRNLLKILLDFEKYKKMFSSTFIENSKLYKNSISKTLSISTEKKEKNKVSKLFKNMFKISDTSTSSLETKLENESEKSYLNEKSLNEELNKKLSHFGKEIQRRGHFYDNEDRMNSVIIEGFAMKKKGSKSVFDLKYFIATKRDLTYFNVVLDAVLNFKDQKEMKISKKSEKILEFKNLIFHKHKQEKERKFSFYFLRKSLDPLFSKTRNSSKKNEENKEISEDANFLRELKISDKEKFDLIFEFPRENVLERWKEMIENHLNRMKGRRVSISELKPLECWVNMGFSYKDSEQEINLERRYIILLNSTITILKCVAIKNILKIDGKFSLEKELTLKVKTRFCAKDFEKLFELTGKTFNRGLKIKINKKTLKCRFEQNIERDFWERKLTQAWSEIIEGDMSSIDINKNYIKAFEEIAPEGPEIAFIFTDTKNSSDIWEKIGSSGAKEIFELYDIKIRSLAKKFNIYEVKSENESFFFVCENMKNAIEFCKEIRNIPNDDLKIAKSGLNLRVGLKYGKFEGKERSGSGRMDYFGNSVNTAARLKDFAKEKQIIITKDEVHYVDQEKFELVDLGKHLLKGLANEINLYNVKENLNL